MREFLVAPSSCGAAPSASSPEFKAIYPFVTTVQGNRFQFRGGDQERMKENLLKLFEKSLRRPLRAKVEA